MSNLAVRLLSAAVALVILVPVLLWGGIFGAQIVVAIAAALGLWEYAGMEDPPRIPELGALAREAGRFPADALVMVTVFLGYFFPPLIGVVLGHLTSAHGEL